uniref:Uncharacterized protein n=1 Tax=Oryza punctata TaxID=4537 RepID=A0A0E0KHN3_ORYPU
MDVLGHGGQRAHQARRLSHGRALVAAAVAAAAAAALAAAVVEALVQVVAPGGELLRAVHSPYGRRRGGEPGEPQLLLRQPRPQLAEGDPARHDEGARLAADVPEAAAGAARHEAAAVAAEQPHRLLLRRHRTIRSIAENRKVRGDEMCAGRANLARIY